MPEDKIKNGFCKNCNGPISWRNEYPKQCKKYDCNCCPAKNQDKCPKEQKFGTFFENLQSFEPKAA